MTDGLALFHDVADAVAKALAGVRDRGPSGGRVGQYALDLVADDAALAVLHRARVGVLSEESGLEFVAGAPTVVIDPVDGSTNCSRGIPWYATSLCLVDDDGPAVALVVNQATGERWSAARGEGAWCDGRQLAAPDRTGLGEAIVGVSAAPPSAPGWAQFRALGAAALDLCLVADGVLDGFVDCGIDQHGPWDYLGGVLICREAGAIVSDAHDRELAVLSHDARRTPVAGVTRAMHDALREVRSRIP
ncbi:MAG: inositol monophosphatase/fructose,6-bisphosphatase family protein [Ilumatobacteraceae bacterium]|nr:inositol monophosphatase/fructose,6-bisphosphatase family protein [Ilumatobacteraceae bacterium]